MTTSDQQLLLFSDALPLGHCVSISPCDMPRKCVFNLLEPLVDVRLQAGKQLLDAHALGLDFSEHVHVVRAAHLWGLLAEEVVSAELLEVDWNRSNALAKVADKFFWKVWVLNL